MQSATQTASVSKKTLWAGRIISALVVPFLLLDSGLKVLRLAPAVEGTARLGYPASLVFPIGIAELICVVLFVIPVLRLSVRYCSQAIWVAQRRPKCDLKIHGSSFQF